MSTIDLNRTQYDQMLARFCRGYGALFALVEDFPEAKRERIGVCGSWTPRQLLAHLSGWVAEAIHRFSVIQAGDPTSIQYDWEIDYAGFNHESVAARAGLSWDETVAELRSLVEGFHQQAQTVSAAEAAADPRYDEWLEGLWKDCVEHMGQLCRFAIE